MDLTFIEREYAYDGSYTDYFLNNQTEELVIRTNYAAGNLLESNKRQRNDGTNGFNKDRSMRKIAEIDPATQLKLLREYHIDVHNKDDMPRLMKWLRNPENAYYRTVDGRI